MKIVVIITLTVLLASGSQAGFFDDLKAGFSGLGDSLHQVFDPVLASASQSISQIGSNLLDQAKEAGSLLLTTTAQGVLNALQPQPTGVQPVSTPLPVTPAPVKRDVRENLQKAIAFGKKVEEMTNDGAKLLHQILNSSVSNLHKLINQYSELGFLYKPIEQVMSEVDTITTSHKDLLTTLESVMKQKIAEELTQEAVKIFGSDVVNSKKRGTTTSLSDLINSAATGIANFFAPHVQIIKDTLNNISAPIHDSLSQLQTTLKPHMDSISQSGQAILQHGHNALSALQDAVTDILAQTMQNIQPHLQNIAQTGSQALGVVANSLANQQPSST